MNLDALTSQINARAKRRKVTLSWLDRSDGSQLGSAFADGKLLCTWTAELVTVSILDGVTPRGPKDYHSLQFFDGEATS